MDRCTFLTLPTKTPTLLFLLIIFLVLIPSPGIAQMVGGTLSQYPTREEQMLLSLHSQWIFEKREYGNNSTAANKTFSEMGVILDHYLRNGCKEQFNGDWKFQELGDVINISWDDQYKVFEGKVLHIVGLQKGWVDKPGYRLFKVYFPKGQLGGANMAFMRMEKGPNSDLMNLEGLRKEKECKYYKIEGTEYNFKRQGNQLVPAPATITIMPESRSRMSYQTFNRNYTLIRVQ